MKIYSAILFGIVTIGLLFSFFYLNEKIDRQIGFVDVNEVYEAFDMTQQLNSRFASYSQKRQQVSDSLHLMMTQLRSSYESSTPTDQEKTRGQIQMIMEHQNQLEQSNAEMKADFERQIWSQLNEYLESFGEENNYKMILGATGDGNVLYGKPGKDITKELIEHINNEYNNKG